MRFYLFTTDGALARRAQDAGIDGIVIDWERRGKHARQRTYDFEINRQGVREVRTVAAACALPVLVRINPLGPRTRDEIARALDAGGTELMLPMARSADEVDRFLRLVGGRAETVVQIETQDLVDDLEAFGRLEWTRAYIGLNDLQISRGRRGSIWSGVADGTVERIFATLPGREIGFGGITVVDGGDPLPFRELLGEMIRLGCGLSFLRRMFHREIAGRDLGAEVLAIRTLASALRVRPADVVERDRVAFHHRLAALA